LYYSQLGIKRRQSERTAKSGAIGAFICPGSIQQQPL
jgi:hypothetical protein